MYPRRFDVGAVCDVRGAGVRESAPPGKDRDASGDAAREAPPAETARAHAADAVLRADLHDLRNAAVEIGQYAHADGASLAEPQRHVAAVIHGNEIRAAGEEPVRHGVRHRSGNGRHRRERRLAGRKDRFRHDAGQPGEFGIIHAVRVLPQYGQRPGDLGERVAQKRESRRRQITEVFVSAPGGHHHGRRAVIEEYAPVIQDAEGFVHQCF